MKRPWQVWTIYGLCLAAVLPALAWLTFTTLGVERDELASRRRAQREEQIRLALWRMDTKLTPLVAQEAARPFDTFGPFLPAVGASDSSPTAGLIPSPLLTQTSDHVLLHFVVDDAGAWTSPQLPNEALEPLAMANGVTIDALARHRERLATLESGVDFRELLAACPTDATTPTAASLEVSSDTADMPQVAQQSSRGVQAKQLALPSDDLVRRQANLLTNTAREAVQQRVALPVALPTPPAADVVGRPLWIGEHLLVVRHVTLGGRSIVQGSWLDWDGLREELLKETADLLPQAELLPVRGALDEGTSHRLATLPVRLVADAMEATDVGLTPLRTSLALAWFCLLLTAGALAVLLRGVMALSQRRGAFVSAVTHELRTPLTTFRMYAELLDEQMVQDEDQRKTYLHTLRVEADRLSHLVENVLAYARLERGRHGAIRERVTIAELIARCESRLAGRASQCGMQLEVELDEHTANSALRTDPTAVEQILFNLVDNACKYATDSKNRTIALRATSESQHVVIRIVDHGPGISAELTRSLFRPFSKSARQAATSAPGVGLGLALCRRLARQLDGELRYESNGKEPGASFALTLPCERS